MTPTVRSRSAPGRAGGRVRPLDVAVAAGSALAAIGAFSVAYNTRVVATPGTGEAPVLDRVSVLVPARNEAGRIGTCVRSLCEQHGVGELEILVLDDCSTDYTAAVAEAAAGGDPRVRVLRGSPLPEGWVGKPHACAQLAAAATGSVLVFLDADVTLEPHAVAAAVAMLRDRGLDVLSPFPRQVAGTVAERLYQPLGLWAWVSTTRVLDGRAATRPVGCALSGQFIVADRGAYEAVGGHGATRDAVVEDYALSVVFREAGRPGGAADGSQIAACRMYEGFTELRAGYTRWMGLLVDTPAKLGASVGGLALAYLLPPAAALRGSRVGLAGYAVAVAGRAISARRFGERVWPDSAAHPVSIALVCAFLADGRRLRRLGRTAWKDRPV